MPSWPSPTCASRPMSIVPSRAGIQICTINVYIHIYDAYEYVYLHIRVCLNRCMTTHCAHLPPASTVTHLHPPTHPPTHTHTYTQIVTRHYEREDLLLVALSNLVPPTRVSQRTWRSAVTCSLGFWQWLCTRTALDREVAPEILEHDSSIRQGDEGTEHAHVEGRFAADGEDATAADASRDAEHHGGSASALPLPPKPQVLYQVDADK